MELLLPLGIFLLWLFMWLSGQWFVRIVTAIPMWFVFAGWLLAAYDKPDGPELRGQVLMGISAVIAWIVSGLPRYCLRLRGSGC